MAPPSRIALSSLFPRQQLYVLEQLADVPIIVASIDPCLSCTDRVAVTRNGRSDVLTKEDLTRLSREKTRRLMQ